MTPPLVYVVTLNWNNCDITLAFLNCCQQLIYPNYKILVVDNGSTDDSVTTISTSYPQVEQVLLKHNIGFSGGMNAGLQYALGQGAEFVFIANNDTVIAPNILDLLVQTALQEDNIAITSPYIYYADDPNRIWSSGAGRYYLTMELRGHLQGQLDQRIDRMPHDVEFAGGCGMLIRRSCLEKVGLFDEQFFMYYEDGDYCLRVLEAGYRIVMVPEAKMWHIVSATIGGFDSPGERYYMALSSIRFFRKYVHDWRWLIVIPYRSISAIKTSLRLIIKQRWQALRAYWRGLLQGVYS